MLTKRDVQKIQLQMTNELNATSRNVLVCVLMLLLLFGLSWLGAQGEEVITSVATERSR